MNEQNDAKEKAIEVALASAMEAHQAVADVANTRWIPSERNQYREGYKHGFDAGWDAHADMSTPSTEALFDAPCDECEHPDHCRTDGCIACKLNKTDEFEYQIKQHELTISTLVTVLELAEGELVVLYKKTGIRGQRVLNVITSVLGDTKEKI